MMNDVATSDLVLIVDTATFMKQPFTETYFFDEEVNYHMTCSVLCIF